MRYKNYQKIKKKKGFVLFFAITLTALVLSITLGVANIALKEIKFGTNARDTNDAFFAADTGIEAVFFADRNGTFCPIPSGSTSSSCDHSSFELGSRGLSCSQVRITKENISGNIETTVVSDGYSHGSENEENGVCEPESNSVARQIEARY